MATFDWTLFTERARRSIVLAQMEAERLGNDFIGTGHVLLGIILEGGSRAANVLDTFNVEFSKVREEVEEVVGRGLPTTDSEMKFAACLERVIQFAAQEATRLGHFADADHMLLGITSDDEFVAMRVLTKLGVDLEKLRAQVST